MEFIEHTVAWCRGEIFEGRIILVFGVIVLMCAFLFYKTGSTPFAKEMILPLLVVGVFYSGVSLAMIVNNNKRIIEYSKSYETSKTKFIQDEKKRVEAFQNWYPYTRYAMSILIALGLGAYFLGGITLKSVGLITILFGLSGFVSDHFSEERAEIYHSEIIKSLKNEKL